MSLRKVLVIYNDHIKPEKTRQTVYEHLRALDLDRNKYQTSFLNTASIIPNYEDVDEKKIRVPAWVTQKKFDVIILHYSFLGMRTVAVHFPKWKKQYLWIKEMDALKIAIPQDEGWYTGVLDLWLCELGVSVVASVHYTPEGPLYPLLRHRARFYPCLPGYIDEEEALRYEKKVIPTRERKLDFVYRARRLPIFFGKGGRFKSQIVDELAKHHRFRKCRSDVSAELSEFIPGSAWLDFLSSGKATLGAQGGYT